MVRTPLASVLDPVLGRLSARSEGILGGEHVPAAGPALVAVHRPIGGRGSRLLDRALRAVRPDVLRVGAERSSELAAAEAWLRRGGLVALRAAPSSVRLALRTGALVCPASLEGASLRFGAPIGTGELSRLRDDEERADWCRLRASALGRARRPRGKRKRHARVAPPLPAFLLEAEIDALAPEERLAAVGELEAWIAHAPAIPRVLDEIGRLRELAFRAAGEGTGRERDLDRFDATYRHLFLWNRSECAIVGGYRIGCTDELLARGGPGELYTSTLFDYGPGVLEGIGTALELGRSFVAPAFQRSYAPLLTLWKGIGAFVARNPRYRSLFGPVSISADYHPLSRQMLGHWLEVGRAHETLFGRVHGRNPLVFDACDGIRPERLRGFAEGGADVAALVPLLEQNERGVPVLLTEYLKLGGKLLALNVDPGFQDALDALVVVDLVGAPRRLLERTMTQDGAAAFLAAHASGRAAG